MKIDIMEWYNRKELKRLDEIIINPPSHPNISKEDAQLMEVLIKEGWFNPIRYESKEIIFVERSENYEALLVGGVFSKRFYRKMCFAIPPFVAIVISFFGLIISLISLFCRV